MYRKKSRAFDWYKTSEFSSTTSAKLYYKYYTNTLYYDTDDGPWRNLLGSNTYSFLRKEQIIFDNLSKSADNLVNNHLVVNSFMGLHYGFYQIIRYNKQIIENPNKKGCVNVWPGKCVFHNRV